MDRQHGRGYNARVKTPTRSVTHEEVDPTRLASIGLELEDIADGDTIALPDLIELAEDRGRPASHYLAAIPLALMVLKTLDVLGPQHGWGIARRIEQISGDLLAVNQGTLYPLLLKLEHEGSIASEWGASENNRRARFYRLTGAGRKQLQAETRDWEQTAAIIARFFKLKAEDLT